MTGGRTDGQAAGPAVLPVRPPAPPAAWYVVVDPPLPGAINMARDQALLDLAERSGRTFLRLYRWEPFTLSFGRHEPALLRYDRERIEALGLACVRRPTGGRAVWHARELTYAVAAPVDAYGNLRTAYRLLHEMLARALARLGLEAGLAPAGVRPGRIDTGACFARPAGGEVMFGGRKLVGSAQLRQGTAFLQHGSMLLEDTQATVTEVTRGASPASLDLPLARALGHPLGFDQAAGAVLAEVAGTSGERREPDLEEIAALAGTHEPHFASPAWTWAR